MAATAGTARAPAGVPQWCPLGPPFFFQPQQDLQQLELLHLFYDHYGCENLTRRQLARDPDHARLRRTGRSSCLAASTQTAIPEQHARDRFAPPVSAAPRSELLLILRSDWLRPSSRRVVDKSLGHSAEPGVITGTAAAVIRSDQRTSRGPRRQNVCRHERLLPVPGEPSCTRGLPAPTET